MKWSNIKLIFLREGRDQLRDRRTLFTIVVLPVLLYPIMGMVMLQMAQFMQEHPTKILIVGADNLCAWNATESDSLPLLSKDASGKPIFDTTKLKSEREGKLLDVTVAAQSSLDDHQMRQQLVEAINEGKFDAGVFFPSNFADELARFRRELLANGSSEESKQEFAAPAPFIYFNQASDKSKIAHERVDNVLHEWRDLIVRENLRTRHIPAAATKPFEVKMQNVADKQSSRAALWSKVLPFVVLIWALTGAFYPAIDLCAGEKERGTLETLLSSPAERGEIVWGKLLTVMTFSMATSLLNMLSMGVTAMVFVHQLQSGPQDMPDFGPPPTFSLVWLLLALPPTSALFSALAMAIAAFARSSKEGQYYLMPLLMVTLPLMLLPMLPTSELTLGTSLIPLSGLMMLLRLLIEGQYLHALKFVPPVVAVTGVCCLLAIRWAVDQFSNESVLFRESERGGISAWLRHLMRVRGPTPSIAEGLLCAVLLLMIQFFARTFQSEVPTRWPDFVSLILITQLAFIATPPLLMSLILTRSPRQTLLLHPPRPSALLVTALLAVALHPAIVSVGALIGELYPISPQVQQAVEPIERLVRTAPLPAAILVLALIPAICEELAFRGFVLSGLRHMGHKWAAITITAVFFGWTHPFMQQQITASLIGIVLGYIAVQSGSIFTVIVFHCLHNSIMVATSRFPESAQEHLQSWPLVTCSLILSAMLLYWLHRLPYQAYPEERLRRALDHQESAPSADQKERMCAEVHSAS